MGKPKFSRKKYETPSHPWQEDRIKSENEMIKKYGLKNKREIWKAQTKLKKYRGQARELLAKVGTGDSQSKKESDQLLMHLNRMNILPLNSNLDDVLALDTESILSRRLQTIAYLKGLSTTPDQARQLISHGHIAIEDRRVTVPSYMVTKDEESKIGYTTDSPLNDLMHPARPKAEFKPSVVKKDKKPEETKKEETKEEITKEPESKPQNDEKVKEEKTDTKEEQSKEEKTDEDTVEQNEEKITEKPKEEQQKEEYKTAEADKTDDKKEDVKNEGGK